MKTTNRTLIVLSLLSLLLSFDSCIEKCEEPINIGYSGVFASFTSSTGEYLYRDANPIFEKDSLKVFDERGHQLLVLAGLQTIPGSVLPYWRFEFGPLYNPMTDKDPYNTEVCKKFIIQYYHNQTDTITTCWKAYKTKCGSSFNYISAYHKGVLVSQDIRTPFAKVTISKD